MRSAWITRARPLRDRRLHLPGVPSRGGGSSRRRRRPGGARALPRGRHPRLSPRRRDVAVRPNGRRGGGPRLQQAPAAHRGRRGRAASRASAGHRARRAQPRAPPLPAVLPGRSLDGEPRHDRRHGGATTRAARVHPLRQHGAQRARGRGDARRRHAARFGPAGASEAPAVAGAAEAARGARRTSSGGDRAPLPKVLRRVGGYNLDTWCRRRHQPRAAAGRVRRHARPSSPSSSCQLQPLPRHRARHLPLPAGSTTRWG